MHLEKYKFVIASFVTHEFLVDPIEIIHSINDVLALVWDVSTLCRKGELHRFPQAISACQLAYIANQGSS